MNTPIMNISIYLIDPQISMTFPFLNKFSFIS